MGIYVLSMAMIPIFGLLRGKNKQLGATLNGIQLFLILAFRDITLGADLSNYSGGYQFISSLSFGELIKRLHLFNVADLVYPYAYESGYCVFNWICSKIGLSFHGFLVVCSAFIIISVTKFISKYSLNEWLSFSLFLGLGMYEYSFGILRQTLAVAILLFAFDCAIEGKTKKFLLLVFLAFTMHRIAILFCIIYFLSRVQINKNKMIRYVGICAIFVIFSNLIYEKVIAFVLAKIGKSTYINITFKINNQIILMFAISIIIILFIDFEIFKEKELNIFMWSFLCAIPIEILGMNNDGFARAVEIFYIAIIVLLPNIVTLYGKKNSQVREEKFLIVSIDTNTIITCIIYLMMFGMMIYTLKDSFIVPYIFYKL